MIIVFAFGTAVLHTGAELRQKMLDAVQQAASRSSDPQAAQAVEFLKTPQGLVVAVILGLILTFLAFVFFSGLGGGVGPGLLRRKDARGSPKYLILERLCLPHRHPFLPPPAFPGYQP